MAISQMPPVPLRTDDPDTFIAKTDVFLPAMNTFADEANQLAANLNAIAMGGAFAMSFRFDSSVVAADPGSGKMRFNVATAATVTSLRISNTDLANINRAAEVGAALGSNSLVKGSLKIAKQADATKFIVFNVTMLTTGSAFATLNVNVTMVAGGNTPFDNNDALLLQFQRSGDVGTAGTLDRRTISIASAATVSPVISNTDLFVITGLASNLIISAPTGTPKDGQSLMFRIRDNGTNRTLAYDSIYRASGEAPFPGTTSPSKTLYMGFIYNEAAAKWDLVALLNNV